MMSSFFFCSFSSIIAIASALVSTRAQPLWVFFLVDLGVVTIGFGYFKNCIIGDKTFLDKLTGVVIEAFLASQARVRC